jgi:NAD(P)H-quinone oxidoreductase subunit I
MVTPIRELGYLPKGIIDGHDLPQNTRRAGQLPEEILEELEAQKQAKSKEGAEAKS